MKTASPGSRSVPTARPFLPAARTRRHNSRRRDGSPIGLPMRHEAYVTKIAFSPDGKTVLTGSWDETARLWNAATGVPIGKPLVHQGIVDLVTFSPNGKLILTVSREGHKGGDAQKGQLWDASDSKPIGPPFHHRHKGYLHVAFSPDSKLLLTGGGGSGGEARLWSTYDGSPIGSPHSTDGSISFVAFSHDGRTVLTGGADGTNGGEARLWHVPGASRANRIG